jgi:hypothetical protein
MSDDAAPFFLDVESSGIARGSFPIEIGWAWADGTALRAQSLLIRPHDSWLAREGAWDPVSVAVHGLTLERLLAEGLEVGAACDALDAAFAGRVVASDTGVGGWDDDWLLTLYEAAGRERPWDIAEKPAGSHVAARLRAAQLLPAVVRPALKPFVPPHTHAAAEDALAFAWEWAMAGRLMEPLAGCDAAAQAAALADLPGLLPRGSWPAIASADGAFRRR